MLVYIVDIKRKIFIRNFLKLLNEDFYWEEVKIMADENNEEKKPEGEEKEKKEGEETA